MSRKVEQLPESRAEKVLFFSKKLKKCCNLIKEVTGKALKIS